MTVLELIRLESSLSGTFGILKANKTILCYTLEPPKKQNKKSVSCIPTGQFYAKNYMSAKYGRICVKLFDVPGRQYIAIHAGNTVVDTKGCVLLGTELGSVSGRKAVLHSNKAMDKLIAGFSDIYNLTIKEDF